MYVLVASNGEDNEWEFTFNLGVYSNMDKAVDQAKKDIDKIKTLAYDKTHQEILVEPFKENSSVKINNGGVYEDRTIIYQNEQFIYIK